MKKGWNQRFRRICHWSDWSDDFWCSTPINSAAQYVKTGTEKFPTWEHPRAVKVILDKHYIDNRGRSWRVDGLQVIEIHKKAELKNLLSVCKKGLQFTCEIEKFGRRCFRWQYYWNLHLFGRTNFSLPMKLENLVDNILNGNTTN